MLFAHMHVCVRANICWAFLSPFDFPFQDGIGADIDPLAKRSRARSHFAVDDDEDEDRFQPEARYKDLVPMHSTSATDSRSAFAFGAPANLSTSPCHIYFPFSCGSVFLRIGNFHRLIWV
jgi:hypothetical protein